MARGLSRVKLVTSDVHAGLIPAIDTTRLNAMGTIPAMDFTASTSYLSRRAIPE